MLRLALVDVPRAAVWTDEIDRGGKASYWIDTLRRARVLAPDADLRFLVGSDQAVGFRGWRESDAIMRLAEPAVLLRPPVCSTEQFDDALAESGDWSADERRWWTERVISAAVMDASATRLREALASTPVGKRAEHPLLRRWLDPRVLGYIESRRLYAG